MNVKLTEKDRQMFAFLFSNYGSGNFVTTPKFLSDYFVGADSNITDYRVRNFIWKMKTLKAIISIGHCGPDDWQRSIDWRHKNRVTRTTRTFMITRNPCDIARVKALFPKKDSDKIKT